MADQGTQDTVTVYVDEETSAILGVLQNAIADEMCAALQSAELPDRLAIEHAVDRTMAQVEHLETKVIRALDARIGALAEQSENARREIDSRLAAAETANGELGDFVRQAVRELHEQMGSYGEHIGSETTATRTELASIRNEIEKIKSDLSEVSCALGHFVEVVNEAVATRETLGRVPGFVVWLLGKHTTLKLMSRGRVHQSPEKRSDFDYRQ